MANRFADLPLDDREVARAPLANVIWQVKFASEVKIADGRAASQFQASLGRDDLKLNQVRTQSLAIQIGSGQPQAGFPQQGEDAWRLASADGSITITLAADALTFETQTYGTWHGNYRPWISSILGALNEVMSPGVTTRVGLRFVNTAFAAAFGAGPFNSPTDLSEFVDDRFLGFDPQGIDSKVGMTQARHVLVIDDLSAAISSALINQESGEYGILIDIDTYREATKVFAVDELLQVSDELHHLELALFQRVLTEHGWNALGPIDGGGAE
jgi:uncharacterized protein (TIGR04255 family)